MKKATLLLAALIATTASFAQGFFQQVSYRGAFGSGANADWTAGWTDLNPQSTVYPGDPGYTGSATMVDYNGSITTNTTWTKNHWYRLTGPVIIKNGATLTIEPGTVIRDDQTGTPTNNAYILVAKGSKIVANGTKEEPIVFTSGFAPGSRTPGDWGGLLLVGRAQTNMYSQTSGHWGALPHGVRQYEALPTVPEAAYGGVFGGHPDHGPLDNNDNSGVLRYVRIEFAGYNYLPNQELNSLTMAGVGSGTTIEFVQTSFGFDDAFEWFGGTVNAKHLVSLGTADDDMDTDEGFAGKVQFALILRDPRYVDIASGGASNGFESDNNTGRSGVTGGLVNTDNALPRTQPTFSNVTVIGPIRNGEQTSDLPTLPASRFANGLIYRTGHSGALYNSIVMGFPTAFNTNGNNMPNGAAHKLSNDSSRVRNTHFARVLNGRAFNQSGLHASVTAFRTRNYMLTGGYNNDSVADATVFGLVSPFYSGSFTLPSFTSVSALLTGSSPYLTGAAFTDSRISGDLIASGILAVSSVTNISTATIREAVEVNSGGTLNVGADLEVIDSLVVRSGATLVVAGSAIIKGSGYVKIESGATVRVSNPEGFFADNKRSGAVQLDGTYMIDGDITVEYNGTAAQVTGNGLSAARRLIINNGSGVTISDNVTVTEVLSLDNGVLTTGGLLTIASTATKTGLIDDFTSGNTGSISGNVNFQRYSTGVYRQLTSPVSGADFSQYGSSCLFIRQFDESQNSWNSVSFFCDANSISPLSSNAVFSTGALTSTFVGTANTGAQSIAMVRTPYLGGPVISYGWNALGNPYPSPISWTSVATLNGGSSAATSTMVAWVWNANTNQYGTVTAAGAVTNGASNIIAPGQGFLLRKASEVAPFSLQMNNSVRVNTTTNTFIRKGAVQLNNEIRLVMSGNKSADEVMINTDAKAIDGFDILDAEKVHSPVEGVHSFYTLADKEELTINTIASVEGSKVLALGYKTPVAGTYTIKASALNNLANGTSVMLEDRVAKKMIALTEGTEYSFDAEGSNNARFFLHINNAASKSAELNAATSVYAASNEVFVNFASAVNAKVSVVNNLGQVVGTYNVENSSNANFSVNVPAGIYTVVVNSTEGTATKKLYIEGR